jgi:hypothetical protein
MVSVRILSRFDEGFSEDKLEVDNRKISGGPLYPVDEVLGLLESNSVQAMTQRALSEVVKLDLDYPESALAEFLMYAIRNGTYIDSEWASINAKSCAACDAYRFRKMETSKSGYEFEAEYYVKFAINKLGKLIMIISCHLSQ